MIRGNYIGTDITGTQPLGNNHDGVLINNGPTGTQVGGASAGEANVIAFNLGDGIYVETGTENTFSANSIFSNIESGIDLVDDGATPNDPEDVDVGPNNLQNYPVLTAATGGASFHIQGTLNSTPNSVFTIEFFSNETCDGSGYGEGASYIGQSLISTDSAGDDAFMEFFSVAVPIGHYVTATATDSGGNTSEFSACIEVFAP